MPHTHTISRGWGGRGWTRP